MAWYRFTADHIFTSAKDRRWSIKFKRGYVGNITREQAEHAEKAGAAVKSAPTRKAAK